jgi:hypothetical protein
MTYLDGVLASPPNMNCVMAPDVPENSEWDDRRMWRKAMDSAVTVLTEKAGVQSVGDPIDNAPGRLRAT